MRGENRCVPVVALLDSGNDKAGVVAAFVR